jgi:hypothetical protein
VSRSSASQIAILHSEELHKSSMPCSIHIQASEDTGFISSAYVVTISDISFSVRVLGTLPVSRGK